MMRKLAIAPTLLLALSLLLASPADARSGIAGGVFHASCRYTRSLPDDPLRLRGQPGASHAHDFFGSTSTNAFSTGDSLLAANRPLGAGTLCSRPGDGSAYWVPGLYDQVSRGVYKRYLPDRVDTYYAGDFDPTIYQATAFPAGFGQIVSEDGNGVAQWGCDLHGTLISAPSRCPSGELVLAIRGSNNCWDGRHLFLPDQSHLSDQGPAQCLARGWKIMPALRGFVVYDVGTAVHAWVLAYDPMYGGYMPTSMAHFDFMSGWDPATIGGLVQTCLNTPANRPSPPSPCKGASN
jgi:hypothetical protein